MTGARAAGTALLALAAWAAPAAAGACEPPPGFRVDGRLEAAGVVVLYRTVPAPVAVGRHFAVEAVVCPPAPDGATLAVDAYMPEHRHGMNYRPQVSRRADGVYRAEGFLLHMPGLWQLRFDVARGDRRERLSADIDLE